VPANHS
jgi:hypothetical protein